MHKNMCEEKEWTDMENRFLHLLRELDGEGYRTAASLGKALSLSEKTVRNQIGRAHV